jgi:hypothetical protein
MSHVYVADEIQKLRTKIQMQERTITNLLTQLKTPRTEAEKSNDTILMSVSMMTEDKGEKELQQVEDSQQTQEDIC